MSSLNLLTAQCQPQSTALTDTELPTWLALVPGWKPVKYDDLPPAIESHFSFDNFYQTMAFVNAVAEIAHGQDHHPDLIVSFGACTLRYSTHSAGGLTPNDFICAAQVSALPEATAA